MHKSLFLSRSIDVPFAKKLSMGMAQKCLFLVVLELIGYPIWFAYNEEIISL